MIKHTPTIYGWNCDLFLYDMYIVMLYQINNKDGWWTGDVSYFFSIFTVRCFCNRLRVEMSRTVISQIKSNMIT